MKSILDSPVMLDQNQHPLRSSGVDGEIFVGFDVNQHFHTLKWYRFLKFPWDFDFDFDPYVTSVQST